MASVGIAELLMLLLVGLGPAAALGFFLLFAEASPPRPLRLEPPPAIEAQARPQAPICAHPRARAARET